MVSAQVTGIFIYPVKSMGGISLEEAILTDTGLLHDRRWMVVTRDGRFVTQRNQPRLALIKTRLENNGVSLSLNGHGSVSIPFESTGGAALSTQVWQDPIEAVDEGDEIADWLTGALQTSEPARIVRMAPGFRRELKQSERFGAGTTTLFADSAPFLVANESSLDALNGKLELEGHPPVPMNRFRPNIVLRGIEAFSEHRAASVSGDGFRLALVDPCQRCVVTTIDQETAERDPSREPFQTLRRINPMPGSGRAPAFAQNARLDTGRGSLIRRGAEVSAR